MALSAGSRSSDGTTASVIIDKILKGCMDNHDWYREYMKSNARRIRADFSFLRDQLPNVHSILDIGGIPPLLIGLFVSSGIEKVAVIDPNVHVFEKYFESAGISYTPVDILSEERDLTHEQFELVCLCEVIEHLGGNMLFALTKATHCVAAGGYLYVTTPNLRSISGALALIRYRSGLASKPGATVRAQYDRASGKYGYYGHLREYTEKEVVDLVESIGFVHVKSSFQARYYAQTRGEKLARLLEYFFPSLRLFGKYLFRRR